MLRGADTIAGVSFPACDVVLYTALLDFIMVYIELSASAVFREQLGCRIAGIAKELVQPKAFQGC